MQVAADIEDPEGVHRSLYEAWQAKSLLYNRTVVSESEQPLVPSIDRLGSGSDYTPFLQHLGIPSAGFSFKGEYPVYHSQVGATVAYARSLSLARKERK
jgi:N-acetylated-alpha-linked acidic dipeptidase